jgi:hypothetical protein
MLYDSYGSMYAETDENVYCFKKDRRVCRYEHESDRIKMRVEAGCSSNPTHGKF